MPRALGYRPTVADGFIVLLHLDKVHSRKLRNISSMAFGGADLRDAYLGCLLDERIARIRLPRPGHPPAHWNFQAGTGAP